MQRRRAPQLVAILALGLALAPAQAAKPTAREAEGLAFLVLGMTSDEDGLSAKVETMLRAKARRLGAVVYEPASVREALEGRIVSPATPPEELAALGRERFKADVVVTGHVAGAEPYDVRLVAVYTDDAKMPRVLRESYACANHHVITIQMARAVYDVLGLQQPTDPLRMLRENPEINRRWREAPNLVPNPGLEQAAAGRNGPARWQPPERQMAWVANPDGPGKVLKFDMDTETAGGYGLDFYSDWIPIEPGATYRFSCRYKTLGPTPKIFLKGYHPFEATDVYPAQRRETYRRQVHPYGEKGKWNRVTADFVPESTRPEQAPTFLKVDLYAYWPAGVIYWDDVVLKKVRDAPPAKADKEAAPAGKSAKGPP